MASAKKIALITGVTGQDGAYLSKFLLGKGYEVVGLVRREPRVNTRNLEYLGAAGGVRLIGANLLDGAEVCGIIDELKPDEIYNLAAQSSVGRSFGDPLGTLEFNVISAANLLEAVRLRNPVSRFYQASSCEMFGNVPEGGLPVTEATAILPQSPYAVSKASAHWITVNYREAYGVYAACGILFNHESPLRGENFVTKKILDAAVRIKMGIARALTLGNLNVSRDWGYAPEYVKAIWLMLQQDAPDDFIICSGGGARTLGEFVSGVFQRLGLDAAEFVETDKSLIRPVDLNVIYGDNSKARRALGWRYDMKFDELISTLVEEEQKFLSWRLNNRIGDG
ncbi:MAG: GDP-mannose 4,6-dehydratase [Deltaproteobacteria bacterium]